MEMFAHQTFFIFAIFSFVHTMENQEKAGSSSSSSKIRNASKARQLAKSFPQRFVHPMCLSMIGKAVEDQIQMQGVHKIMQPAHRWSHMRRHAGTLKGDESASHENITLLDKRIQQNTQRKDKEKLQNERKQSVRAKAVAIDGLNLIHSDMKIFKDTNWLPSHVTNEMIDAHAKPKTPLKIL